MPSWDRPRGGSDNGGDKPPAPKEPPYVPYPPVNPAPARQAHHDRPAAEAKNRTAEGTSGQGDGQGQSEGTSQNSDSLRAKDKLLKNGELATGKAPPRAGTAQTRPATAATTSAAPATRAARPTAALQRTPW
ncbi:MAG TPA: hypothetical protein VGG75_20360 [Trebonia sp.]|jgi:hypothetical protein